MTSLYMAGMMQAIDLMERAQQKGLTFNGKKCSIRREAVSFFGVTFSKDGISPDTRKIQGILDMPTPKDTIQL